MDEEVTETTGLVNTKKITIQATETVKLGKRGVISKVLEYLIYFGVRILCMLIWPVTRIASIISRHHPVSPISNPILLNSAYKIAEKIRTKEVSCEDVIQSFIARIRVVNPILNAVVDDRFTLAIEDAKKVDTFLASTTKSIEEIAKDTPLLGVPLTVKESVALKGCSNNAGRKVPKNRIALEDAVTVGLLKKAGAIPLCVTNTPELCMNWETFNKVTGVTNNPYDTRRTTGGSSGGECALLSSGASIIGVGSDVAGSCRIPAMFTGVFGHKPSPGYVSNKGHMPCSNDKMWDTYFTIGLLTRYAEDLPLMLHYMISDSEKAKSLRLLEPVEISTIKVYYMEDDGGTAVTNSVDNEIKEGIRKAVHYLEHECGLKVEKVNIDMEDVFELVSVFFLLMDGVHNVFEIDDDHPDDWRPVWKETLKFCLFCSDYNMTSILYGVVKKLAGTIPQKRFKVLSARKAALFKKFADMLGDDGVFLYPTFTNVAHYHNQIFYKFLNYIYAGLFSMLGLPVTNVTVGLGKSKLPLGFQVAAGQGQDRLSIAIAKELESGFGGWVSPVPITCV